ncbi:MAG: CYTH domain-containing protein [Myxococcales bacterium]|jgi:adenylate cyclase
MGEEIERKFLVVGEDWRREATGTPYRQGFLSTEPERTVRVRVAGDRGSITVKGKTSGARRAEFEYAIPVHDARQMLDTLCRKPLIEKTRYSLTVGDHVWDIDVFEGVNAGLVVAEIELRTEDEGFEKPSWIGDEVTGDPRYFNSNLVAHPYDTW